jgi:nucleoid-associated protein YgaU
MASPPVVATVAPPVVKPAPPVSAVVASAPPPVAAVVQPAVPVSAPTAAAVETSIPTLVAEPVGGPVSGRFASGKAIIRHGDNLWTIAKRVYGYGVQYTTIFQANDDQIRNPNLIYPGQVFDLPKSKAGG